MFSSTVFNYITQRGLHKFHAFLNTGMADTHLIPRFIIVVQGAKKKEETTV